VASLEQTTEVNEGDYGHMNSIADEEGHVHSNGKFDGVGVRIGSDSGKGLNVDGVTFQACLETVASNDDFTALKSAKRQSNGPGETVVNWDRVLEILNGRFYEAIVKPQRQAARLLYHYALTHVNVCRLAPSRAGIAPRLTGRTMNVCREHNYQLAVTRLKPHEI
jgi:hypothetical protein